MPPRGGRPDYDQTLKLLLTRAHDGFLRLVAPGLRWQRDRSPELPASRRQADLVWEVERPDGGRGLLHIELQIKVEPNLRERLLEYNVRLLRRDRLPVRSVVVFLRETPRVPVSPLAIIWGHDELLRYAFDVVRLWEIPQEQVLASQDVALWPLASLMAGATPAVIADVAGRIAEMPLPRHERVDLAGILATLAGLRFSRDVVEQTIRSHPMIRDILRESSFAAIMRDEGKQEGIQEGKQEGRQEGQRELAHMALESRFGPLTADVLAALRTADEATLLAVVLHLATDNVEQVRQRLGLT